MLCCRHKKSHTQHLILSLQEVTLDPLQKKAITARLQTMLEEYSDRTGRYSRSFHSLRVIITVGSLIVPALLSVQYNVNTAATQIDEAVYWIVWMLSLLVTISNGIVTLFKVDKKYYVLNTTFQHLVSESWQFIELSGKYSGHKTPSLTPTHQNQFVIFATNLEKIRMRNIEDEYYKITEQHVSSAVTAANQQQQPQQIDNLVPPSAMPPQNSEQTVNGTTALRRQNTQTSSLARGPSTVFETPRQSQGAQAPLLSVDESSA